MMNKLGFSFNLPNGDIMHLQLKQVKGAKPWLVLVHDQELGRIVKEEEGWKQHSGEVLSEELIYNIGLVNFRSFEKMFEEFVPDMIKEEWAINFKVYNHNFDEDFVKQLRRKNEKPDYYAIKKW